MVADTPVKKRGRKPKADVQLEFEQLTQEVQEEAASSSAKIRQMLKLQEEEIRNSVKDVSVEEVVRRFADFRVNLSTIMGPLSDSITQEIQLLSNLRQSVSLEQRELERLHKIDVAQTTIDQLIAEYAQRQEELEAEVTSMQEQWDSDQATREAEVEEYDDNLAKSRKRETEEYEYKKNLERKKAQDKYDEELRLREKQNKEKQEALERSWNERESTIRGLEDELQQLRNTVNEFPDRLEQGVAKATSEATRLTEQRLSHELALVKRDAEAEKRIAQMRIETLENQINQQDARIAVMQSQLDEAKKQVQDIAVKAIEGASGAKALSHINQIAMEQAKGRPGQA